jgi:hypothetical protein
MIVMRRNNPCVGKLFNLSLGDPRGLRFELPSKQEVVGEAVNVDESDADDWPPLRNRFWGTEGTVDFAWPPLSIPNTRCEIRPFPQTLRTSVAKTVLDNEDSAHDGRADAQ